MAGCNGCAGCAKEQSGCGRCCQTQDRTPIPLDAFERDVLLALDGGEVLPIARLVVEESGQSLAPVWLQLPTDAQKTAEENGKQLASMTEKGLLSLVYTRPIDGYPYLEYTTATLVHAFCKQVREAGNTPRVDLGFMRATAKGIASLGAWQDA